MVCCVTLYTADGKILSVFTLIVLFVGKYLAYIVKASSQIGLQKAIHIFLY